MNSDFRDMLRLFAAHKVRYLVVGGYAAMHYLGRSALVKAKKRAGRPQDLADLDELRRALRP